MFALKFLGLGSVGLHSAFRWPVPEGTEPGAWVGAAGELEMCSSGVHACRLGIGMLDWVDDELWVIELEEHVDLGGDLVLSPRGRLIRRVQGWDGAAAAAFAVACEGRARELASPEFAADAAALLTGSRPETGATPPGEGPPTPGGIAANLGFVAAHAVAAAQAARNLDDPGYEECFAAERRWQLAWLVDRLRLDEVGA